MKTILNADGCRIIPLRSEADWQSVRQRVEAIESACAPNPWMSWDASFALWSHFHRHKTCWLIEVPTTGPLPAAALWLEDRQRRHRLDWKILRSLDSMSMGIPPLFIPIGAGESAHRALAAAMPTVSRHTGCDLVSLYRIEDGPGRSLLSSLENAGIRVRCAEYTRNQVISLGDDLTPYLEQKMTTKVKRNVRIARRQILEDHGAPASFERMRGSPEENENARRLWGEFLRLRDQSWQIAATGTEHIVDPSALNAWFSDIVRVWERRGFLDLHLVRLGSEYVSALLILSRGASNWCTYTYYDEVYAACSPGLIGFLHAIQTVHNEGARRLDLGGEGAPWKNRWATTEEPLLTLEWPLGGWKADLWRLRAAIRGKSASV